MTRAILTCSPYFVDLALNELRRYHPQIGVVQPLFPGSLLLDFAGSFDQLTAPWRDRLPVYLHHGFPVDETLVLDHPNALKHVLRRLASPGTVVQARSLIEPEQPFSQLQLDQIVGPRQSRAEWRPARGKVLSVLVVPMEGGAVAYFGVSPAEQNISPWAGGQIPIREPVSNRAGYKLLEALGLFSIRLRPNEHVLDLGASPGAWTTLLRRRGLRVTAVAPTPMYPWLRFDSGVDHQPMRAEAYLERCRTTFDFIVNDMKLDAQDSARLMVDYADHLRPQGIALMTLKLRERNQRQVLDHSFRILRRRYRILRLRQLVSNRLEVTLFLRRNY